MAKAKDKKSMIQDITNRYRVTAREARDIVTAVGTLGRTIVDKNIVPGGSNNSLAGKNIDSGNQSKKAKIEAATRNLVKQTRETASAASKGKKGTTSAKVATDFRDRYGNPRGGRYEAAKKRTK
jgi:hypothetical protein